MTRRNGRASNSPVISVPVPVPNDELKLDMANVQP